MAPEFTPEQQAAIERRDVSLLVRAGAGTGKTSVLVERFVQAVREDEVEVERILAITFTEKAASEMKERVRERLVELGMRDEARAAEGAWISTIHRFCARVLRTHALSAGIDPEYRVLDELESERLGLDAFDRAIDDLLREAAGDHLEQVASYTPDRLRDMVRTAFSWQRSRGRPPPAHGAATRAARRDGRGGAAGGRGTGRGGRPRAARRAARPSTRRSRSWSAAGEATADGALPELGALGELRLQARQHEGAPVRRRCGEYLEALAAYRRRRDGPRRAPHPGAAGGAGGGLRRPPRAAQARALRPRLRGPRADHARPAEGQRGHPPFLRRALRPRAGGRVPGRQPAPERAAGDARPRQPVPRRRRAPVDLRLPQRRRRGVHRPPRRGRRRGSRPERDRELPQPPEVLDGIDLAFSRLWGEEFEPLHAGRNGGPAPEPRVELLVTDREKRRWDARFGEDEEAPFGRSLRSSTPWRAAEARLLARRLEEVAAEGGWELGRHRRAAARHHPHDPVRARPGGARASPPTWWAVAATGASSRWATCATGWRRWPTRATSCPCSRCWPRPWWACRSTAWLCWPCAPTRPDPTRGGRSRTRPRGSSTGCPRATSGGCARSPGCSPRSAPPPRACRWSG